MHLRCPHCRNAFELLDDSSATEVVCPSCHSKISFEELLSLDPSITESLDVEAMTFLNEGETIAHFTIRETVGRGGFGTVYRAFDQHLERDVAIKMPRMQKLTRWQAESFIREAQAAAQLRDPNIVTVHEVGRKDNQIYIVSDFIDGISLTQWKKQFNPTQQEIASMMATIARSLHKAHQRGIIHRDMKPGNVMVDSEGSPHITDFGLAKRENPEEISITTTGQVIGTPAYMSPEQASGHADQADGRTDVYSMGVILYQLLAGKRPFRGESDLLINEVREGNPEPIRVHNSAVNPDLEAIAMKAMAVKPGQRFATAETFADDLERYTEGRPTLTRPPGPARKAILFARRHAVAMTIASLLLVIVGGSLYFLYQPDPPPKVVIEPAKPVDTRKQVMFQVEPRVPGTEVAIAKVDFKVKGKLDLESIYKPVFDEESGNYEVKLDTGWYIIEADVPGVGVQEVWRRIPEDEFEKRRREHKHSCWQFAGDQVLLNPVVVVPVKQESEFLFSVGDLELALQSTVTMDASAEGLFDMNGDPRMQYKDHRIPAFLIGRREISAQEYKDVMGTFPPAMNKRLDGDVNGDAPVTNVTFFDALEYCERTGVRLMTFPEYVRAATNAGKTEYPAGDEYVVDRDWPITIVGAPELDVTIDEPFVQGLYSSVFEWTQHVELLLDPGTNKVIRGTNDRYYSEVVTVVGGPPGTFIKGGEIKGETIIGPRNCLVAIMTETDNDNLGFRVARSLSRRISDSDTMAAD